MVVVVVAVPVFWGLWLCSRLLVTNLQAEQDEPGRHGASLSPCRQCHP